jgi:hypothetical protein
MRSLLYLLSLSGPASAAPTAEPGEQTRTLVVDVRPDPPRPPRKPLPRPDLGPIDLVRTPSSLVLDGSIDDEPWQIAALGPPLLPLTTGRAPPHLTSRWLATPDGLGVALSPVPPDHTVTVSVDPTSAQQRWVRVTISGDGSTAESCSADPGVHLPMADGTDMAAVSCRFTTIPTARQGEDIEVLFPWAVLGPSHEGAMVHVVIKGPAAQGGTWTVSGSPAAFPTYGRALRPKAPSPSISLAAPGAHPITRASAVIPGLKGPTRWVWETRVNDRLQAHGWLDLQPDAQGTAKASFDLPGPWVHRTAVTVRDPDQPHLGRGASVLGNRWYRDLTLSTPVHRDHLHFRYFLSASPGPLPIRIRSLDGDLLGTGEVTFPGGAGSAVVALDPSWPEWIEVEIGDLLDPGTLARRSSEL